ncbi:MAG: hypothetical protein ACI9MB_005283 [Verrucomicrobiales bacterium]|jgi:hypothetical protein
MLGLAEELLALRSKRRNLSQNYRGAEARDHGIRQAEAIVRAGQVAFGIRDDDLLGLKMSAVEKALIASIIRTETSVPVAWITAKLKMGTTANVTRASKSIVGRLPGDRRLKRVMKQIHATIPSCPNFLT